jgi:hypothetical protein
LLSSPTTGEGGNHGCEGDFGKEVCCEAEREEAKLIALACSKPPKGRARWTLRLLENKVVELGIVDRASDSTIGRALKKTLFSPIAANGPSDKASPCASTRYLRVRASRRGGTPSRVLAAPAARADRWLDD